MEIFLMPPQREHVMERFLLNIVGRIHMCIEVKDNENGKRNGVIERKPKSFLF